MTPSPVLPAALDVLDRADALAAQLRTVVQASSAHPPAIVEQALAEHLAAQELACGSPSPSGSNARFGWRRPETLADRDHRLSRVNFWSRWKPRWLSGEMLITGIVALLVTLVCRGVFSAFSDDAMAAPWVGAIMAGVFSIGISFIERCWRPLAHYCSGTHLEDFDADLPSPLNEYLAHASCRTYLRQVLESGVPQFLAGDAKALERALNQARANESARLWQESQARERQAQQEEAAQRAAMRPKRMAAIAQALDQAS